MADFRALILQRHRQLKWKAFDRLEAGLMILCGVCITMFTLAVFLDVLTRSIGAPWLWLQQVTTAFFAWGVFVGMAAATRRNDHFYLTEITKRMTGAPRSTIEIANRLVVLVVAVLLVWFGTKNALLDLGSYRMPSLIPLTVYTAIVPIAGVLIFLFTLEQLVCGWQNGFEGPEDRDDTREAVRMSPAGVLILMTVLFLAFGYMGVPVSFALIAGVLVATAFTPISMQSMVGQLFHGIDSETLLAVPFFLLVGELMASSDVATRMIRLSQTLVGHLRGGLAQVVTLFSMFFAGISGSSTADVAVLSRTIAHDMDKEGYDRAFTAALIASASTMANLIPPSIMAVVYGATGNVSIGGLFLAGVVPGVLIGIGLMVYSYFWGPVGVLKKRAPMSEVIVAARGSALPLVIPVIIMGGILTGWFTPTEAGMMAAVYILVVLIPVLNRGHVRELPRDFMYAGLLYSLPLAAVAGASAFGWMVAYLRGPDIVAAHITAFAGDERRR